jgi:hypothetical protein
MRTIQDDRAQMGRLLAELSRHVAAATEANSEEARRAALRKIEAEMWAAIYLSFDIEEKSQSSSRAEQALAQRAGMEMERL